MFLANCYDPKNSTLGYEMRDFLTTAARRKALQFLGLLGGFFGKEKRHEIIFTYHSVDDSCSPISTPVDTFKAQMLCLRDLGYCGVSLSEFLDSRNQGCSRKRVALTFDDGCKNFIEVVVPTLRALGFTATVFVVAEQVGRRGDWERMAGVPNFALMNWGDIKDCVRSGMEIGSHTNRHPHLSKLSPQEQFNEISLSKSIIEERIAQSVRTFCYPYGNYSEGSIACVRSAGYEAAVTTDFDYYSDQHDHACLPRIGMNRINSEDKDAQLLYLKAALKGTVKHYSKFKISFG